MTSVHSNCVKDVNGITLLSCVYNGYQKIRCNVMNWSNVMNERIFFF